MLAYTVLVKSFFLFSIVLSGLLTGLQEGAGRNEQAEAAKQQFCLPADKVLSPAKDNPNCTQLVDIVQIHPPKLIHSTDPEFPRGDRISGTCVLSIIVGVDGKPTNITVKRSLRPDYDEKAMEAIHKFRFRPATLDGKTVPMQINIEQTFTVR